MKHMTLCGNLKFYDAMHMHTAVHTLTHINTPLEAHTHTYKPQTNTEHHPYIQKGFKTR